MQSSPKTLVFFAVFMTAISALADWYASRHAFFYTTLNYHFQSMLCLCLVILLFTQHMSKPHNMALLCRLLRRPWTFLKFLFSNVSHRKYLGVLATMVIRVNYSAWFIVLLASDQLIRALIGRLMGKHPTRCNLSIFNSVHPLFPLFADALDTPLEPDHGYYSQATAYTLAVASRLAYEDVSVVCYELQRDGFHVDTSFLPIAYHNNCAYVVEKDDTIYVVFRGTNPMNIQNFVTDFNIGMKTVFAKNKPIGRVHRGFWDAMGDVESPAMTQPSTKLNIELSAVSLYRTLSTTLKALMDIICFTAKHLVHHLSDPVDNSWAGLDTDVRYQSMYTQAEQWALSLMASPSHTNGGRKKLYIAGHSLGGALGTIFLAKMINSNSPLLQAFEGLYTFGQPKIGDAKFTQSFPVHITHRIFHHTYNNDIVTRLPPPLTHPYASPPGTMVFIDSTYNITLQPPHPSTLEPVPVGPIAFFDKSGLLDSNVIRRLPQESWLRIMFRLVFPFFINDHLPSEYCASLLRGRITGTYSIAPNSCSKRTTTIDEGIFSDDLRPTVLH